MALVVKNPPANAGGLRCEFSPWVGKILWRKERQLTPVFLPGEIHGQRRLVGYCPWIIKSWTRLKELSMGTEEVNASNQSIWGGCMGMRHAFKEHCFCGSTLEGLIPLRGGDDWNLRKFDIQRCSFKDMNKKPEVQPPLALWLGSFLYSWDIFLSKLIMNLKMCFIFYQAFSMILKEAFFWVCFSSA